MYVRTEVGYRGASFSGWQIQPDRMTVQGYIENILEELFGAKTAVKYASRTDRGVHASCQIISFPVPAGISPEDVERMLNSGLGRDIHVKNTVECSSDFSPRYDARKRVYIYRILNGRVAICDMEDFAWYIPQVMGCEEIEKAVSIFCGRHDFRRFSVNNDRKNTELNLMSTVKKNGCLYIFTFESRYFLTHMIRYIVGSIAAVGKGKIDADSILKMFAEPGPVCSYCAPPHGLELSSIEY